MEGTPKFQGQENIEHIEDWKVRREGAVDEAKTHIAGIVGYETMTNNEKIQALDDLMNRLSFSERGELQNGNRYVVREIGKTWETLRAQEAMRERLQQLGIAA